MNQMIQAEEYIAELTSLLRQAFGERLLYVGLQGSCYRGEANENSDIDVMVVLDRLTASDMDVYRELLRRIGNSDRSCGFICGGEELRHWNPCEICQLLHTTGDRYGKLAALVPAYTLEDVKLYGRLSVNNLYHALCHQYIHASPGENRAGLPALYKAAFFILQNRYFLRTGEFVLTRRELLPRLVGKDRAVLSKAAELRENDAWDFGEAFELLLDWCREIAAQPD